MRGRDYIRIVYIYIKGDGLNRNLSKIGSNFGLYSATAHSPAFGRSPNPPHSPARNRNISPNVNPRSPGEGERKHFFNVVNELSTIKTDFEEAESDDTTSNISPNISNNALNSLGEESGRLLSGGMRLRVRSPVGKD